MKFTAQIKQLKLQRSASEDMIASLTLVTENTDIMALAAIPGDALVTVEIRGEYES